MADLNQTISNSVTAQGPGEVNLWGTMVWGTDNWGSSQDTWVDIGKWLANSQGSSSAVSKEVGIWLANNQGATSAITALYKTDSNGYIFFLKGGSTNGVDRYDPNWSEETEAATGYTERTKQSTTWVAA